jgi:hypothetical protein
MYLSARSALRYAVTVESAVKKCLAKRSTDLYAGEMEELYKVVDKL